jgi:hypothetical protein
LEERCLWNNAALDHGTSDGMGGYLITFELSRQWRLPRGSFVKQLDTDNCGPLACSKIIKLYDRIPLERIEQEYKSMGLRRMVFDTWQLFLRTRDNDLVVTIRDKRPPKQQDGEDYARAAESTTMSTADVSIDVCLCFLDEPDKDIVSWPCCKQLMHRELGNSTVYVVIVLQTLMT